MGTIRISEPSTGAADEMLRMKYCLRQERRRKATAMDAMEIATIFMFIESAHSYTGHRLHSKIEAGLAGLLS